MTRTCLFGGSFDPIHQGHLAMVRAALEAGGQDRVVILPAATPPHKRTLSAPAADRLRMARAACAGMAGVEVSDLEIRRGGVSYTIDTVRAWRAEADPAARLAWLIGADSLPHLAGWRESAALFELCDFLVVPRTGFPPSCLEGVAGLSTAVRRRLEAAFLEVAPVDISSTTVRERLAAGAGVDGLLPAAVIDHIRHRGLYGVEATR